MGNDFFDIVGTDLPVLRICDRCKLLYVSDLPKYNNPTRICDPGYCELVIPYCPCFDESLDTEGEVSKCLYPDCE